MKWQYKLAIKTTENPQVSFRLGMGIQEFLDLQVFLPGLPADEGFLKIIAV